MADSFHGIRAHSLGGRYIIFCVGQDDEHIKEFIAWAGKNGIPLKQLIGQYKGAREKSFITKYEYFDRVCEWTVEEESVLLLDEPDFFGRRMATLVYGGHEAPAGEFTAVTAMEAMKEDSYTFDPLTETYYICK